MTVRLQLATMVGSQIPEVVRFTFLLPLPNACEVTGLLSIIGALVAAASMLLCMTGAGSTDFLLLVKFTV